MRAFIVTSCLLAAVPALAQERPLPEPQSFLQQARRRLQTDEQAQSQYTYVETRRQQRLDKSGQPIGDSVRVFESYPAFPGERRRWERLIEEDGKPVPAAELAKHDRERQRAAEEYARKLAKQTDDDRAKEAREREKRQRESADAVDDLFRLYDIKMIGRDSVERHDTIVFSLTPRPDVKPRTDGGRILRHFKGRAWVSESEYELVRLEVEAIDDVSFGIGLLARVHKGTTASFQRRKVNDEVWLPAVATYTASARVLLLKTLRVGGTSEFSNYRKFTVDTSTIYAPSRPPP